MLLIEPIKSKRGSVGIYLQHSDIRVSVGAVMTAILSDMFQPLDVRLGVAVDLTDKAGVLPNMHSGVCRKAGLENRSVRGPFCREGWEC